VLLLACPLLHVFVHRGHGGQGDHSGHTSRTLDDPLGDQRATAESAAPTSRTGGDSRWSATRQPTGCGRSW
jgi:hypothetical protein